ncbi:hypothetical protein H7U37_02460 [Pseudoflavonifractor phocaeensis]|uniref:hypothetical protein n=1 Tax=Pseudoflavonifractor phocaeensis TaxID=1870988 RepID=UPI001956FB08|nr:hypothetical protein [Pseudoflavonifractor phocaeensis]MBM6869163.1 hypothetical protein [Pseudoflavonifractor phocaeensis]MBM6937391.1 hypothetical protein [Pseudoflavonifractor phocaeensis]
MNGLPGLSFSFQRENQRWMIQKSGIHLRLCRSVQAVDAFGLLKNDFGFRHFLSHGVGTAPNKK